MTCVQQLCHAAAVPPAQVLLRVGIVRSKRAPTRQHPYGCELPLHTRHARLARSSKASAAALSQMLSSRSADKHCALLLLVILGPGTVFVDMHVVVLHLTCGTVPAS